MWYTRKFRSRLVVEIWIGVSQISNHLIQACWFSIIQDNHSELVLRIILIASSSDCIHDQIIIFTTARHKDINSWNIIANQSELWSSSFLESKHCPEVLHEDRYGHHDLDCDKHPSQWEERSFGVLSRDDEDYPQSKVQPVQRKRDTDKDWSEVEEFPLVSIPELSVISAV